MALSVISTSIAKMVSWKEKHKSPLVAVWGKKGREKRKTMEGRGEGRGDNGEESGMGGPERRQPRQCPGRSIEGAPDSPCS